MQPATLSRIGLQPGRRRIRVLRLSPPESRPVSRWAPRRSPPQSKVTPHLWMCTFAKAESSPPVGGRSPQSVELSQSARQPAQSALLGTSLLLRLHRLPIRVLLSVLRSTSGRPPCRSRNRCCSLCDTIPRGSIPTAPKADCSSTSSLVYPGGWSQVAPPTHRAGRSPVLCHTSARTPC